MITNNNNYLEITRSGEPHMCIFFVLLQPLLLVRTAANLCSTSWSSGPSPTVGSRSGCSLSHMGPQHPVVEQLTDCRACKYHLV